MKAEWRGRQAFAEVAEALGVGTDDILASWLIDGGGLGVMFTRAPDLEAPVYAARLYRVREQAPTGDTVRDLFSKRGIAGRVPPGT